MKIATLLKHTTFQCAACGKSCVSLAASIECFLTHGDESDEAPARSIELWRASADQEAAEAYRDVDVGPGYLELLAEVMKEGADKPLWFTGPCGRFWANVSGVEPVRLWELSVRGTPYLDLPYKRSKHCSSGNHGRDEGGN